MLLLLTLSRAARLLAHTQLLCTLPLPQNPAHGVHSGFLVLRFYGSKSAFLHYVSQRGALGANTLEEFSAIVEK